MYRTLRIGQFSSFGIPIVLIGLIVAISKSTIFHNNPSVVSVGITIDLLFTVPLIHFLLIRKATIPKITIFPFFLIGLLVAKMVLPVENQVSLHFVRIWILPVIEAIVILFLVRKIRQAISDFKQDGETATDFFTALKMSVQNFCHDL